MCTSLCAWWWWWWWWSWSLRGRLGCVRSPVPAVPGTGPGLLGTTETVLCASSRVRKLAPNCMGSLDSAPAGCATMSAPEGAPYLTGRGRFGCVCDCGWGRAMLSHTPGYTSVYLCCFFFQGCASTHPCSVVPQGCASSHPCWVVPQDCVFTHPCTAVLLGCASTHPRSGCLPFCFPPSLLLSSAL